MDTALYSKQIPPVQIAMKFAVGYRHARHGGLAGLMHWIGYVVAGIVVISLLFWAFVPQQYMYVWWSWFTWVVLVLFIATQTLGAQVIERSETRRKKAEFLRRFELAVRAFAQHPAKNESTAAGAAALANLPRRLFMPHPQVVKSIMTAYQSRDQTAIEGEKAWAATASWWKRMFPPKVK
jgi:hypothetical protein